MDTHHAQRNATGRAALAAEVASQNRGDRPIDLPFTAGLPHQEWLRLPKTGTRCHVSGLSRSTINRLILPSNVNGHNPPVRSAVLKQRWAVRGIRLVSRTSLINYINSLDHASATAATSSPSATEAINCADSAFHREPTTADVTYEEQVEREHIAYLNQDPEAPDRPAQRSCTEGELNFLRKMSRKTQVMRAQVNGRWPEVRGLKEGGSQ